MKFLSPLIVCNFGHYFHILTCTQELLIHWFVCRCVYIQYVQLSTM